MDRCSCVGVGKDPGWNSVIWNVHNWHPGETWSQEHLQVSSEPWETQKLLSKWESVDLFLHCSCGPAVGWQQRPGRNRKRQIQGSGRGPWTVSCLSVHCDIPLLILGSPMEARKVPVCGFLQSVGFLTLRGVLCGGACAGTRSSKKPSRWRLSQIDEEAFTILRSSDWNRQGSRGEHKRISEGWSVYEQTKLSKINGPERSEWPDSHTRTRWGGFENLLYIETNWGGRSSAGHEP